MAFGEEIPELVDGVPTFHADVLEPGPQAAPGINWWLWVLVALGAYLIFSDDKK